MTHRVSAEPPDIARKDTYAELEMARLHFTKIVFALGLAANGGDRITKEVGIRRRIRPTKVKEMEFLDGRERRP
jgi:hypothetical protein